jgi:flagellar biosynthesis/type III secretory pathway protein FliH
MYKAEESYLAEAHGINLGRIYGRQQGREEGVEEGYQRGHQDGYGRGWDAGIAAGNVQILKQMEFTRQHIADKELLQRELAQQRDLIAQLEAKVTSLDTKFREKSEQYVDQLWQHNRSIVFMNSVRKVLEDLTNEDTPIATRVRRLFAERYAEQVSEALGKGGIKTPPEKDEKFAKSLPQTQQFILDMLNPDR